MFVLLIIIFVLTVACLGIYLSIVWNNDYWKKRGVPHETPKFFFGNFKDVMNGEIHIGILHQQIYKKYSSVPYVGYYKMKTPALLVRDVELVKNVLTRDFNNFSHNDFQVDQDADPIWFTNPFGKKDEDWKIARGQWSTSLTMSKVKTMYPAIRAKSKALVEYLKEHVRNNPKEPLEARELSANFLTDAIVSAVFGLEVDSFNHNDNVFRRITRSVFISTFWDGIKNLLFVVFPWLAKILKLRFVPKESEKALIKIAKDMIACSKETGMLKNDVYEVMKKYNERNDINEQLSVMELAGRVFGFLLDGTETSSSVISFMLYELALNPHIQSKLRTELNKAFPAKEDISHDDLIKLPYLEMLFSETLRMYPASLSINRLCSKSCELPPVVSGAKPIQIPVGMPITIPTYALHMDPQYFPDPERFDPERFSEENKEKIIKYSYLPFGEGPRICIGIKLAHAQSKIVIAEIIRNFELRVLSPKSQKKPIIPDPNIFINRAPGPMLINFTQLYN